MSRATEGKQKALRIFVDIALPDLTGMTAEQAYLQGVRDTVKILASSTEEVAKMLGERGIRREH